MGSLPKNGNYSVFLLYWSSIESRQAPDLVSSGLTSREELAIFFVSNGMKQQKPKKLTILAILDGWGIGPRDNTNAIWLAKTPVIDSLAKKYPYTELGATGTEVGLENRQTSGSETGHMNIGAGRVVEQDSRVISESINTGTFFHNPAFWARFRM